MYLGLILIYFMVLYNFSDGFKKIIVGSMLKAKIHMVLVCKRRCLTPWQLFLKEYGQPAG